MHALPVLLTLVMHALPESATLGSQQSLLVYYWPVSTTPVRHDVTGVNDTRKECITAVVDTGEMHSDNSYFKPILYQNFFYTELILNRLSHTELNLCVLHTELI
jgi:hypothetical protein